MLGGPKSCLDCGLHDSAVAEEVDQAVESARAADFDGKTLRVGTWGGSWRDSLEKTVGAKVEARGAKVEYVLDSPTGNAAKLIAARGRAAPFDSMDAAPNSPGVWRFQT